jgi:hypothetical protein
LYSVDNQVVNLRLVSIARRTVALSVYDLFMFPKDYARFRYACVRK